VDASPGASGGPGTAVATAAPSPAVTPSPALGATPPPRATPTLAGQQVALVSDVKPHEALAITDPLTGDPAFLFKLASGRVACFDALCTHEGCPVEFDPSSELLFCPCHGAVFDPAHGAKVLRGPTRRPLAELPLTIDPQTGAITLTG
jgi:thiosulfate dehydrogenase [quinone] large subunit